jgi:ABC-2 type transport system ATP-binding protein
VAVIEAQQVSKRYPRVTALEGLDLTVGDGITGLGGANGAAKDRIAGI